MSALIVLFALVGLVVLLPLLVLLCQGLFWWTVGTLLATTTVIVRGVTGGAR